MSNACLPENMYDELIHVGTFSSDPNARTIDDILYDYRKTSAAVQAEEEQRQEIMHSPEYLMLEVEKKKIEAKQEMLLAGIPDSREEFAMDKAELLRWMQDSGREQIGEFKAVPRNNKRVDTKMLMDACDGDLDMFNTIVACTQTAVNKFCAGISDNVLKKRLKACIVPDGVTFVDIVPVESDAA